MEDTVERIHYNLEEDSPCSLKQNQLIKVQWLLHLENVTGYEIPFTILLMNNFKKYTVNQRLLVSANTRLDVSDVIFVMSFL